MKIKKLIRLGVITVILLLPLFFWLIEKPVNLRFVNLSISTTSFGQIFGLMGMTILSLTVILGARLKFLEDYFWGLNRIYINHHNFGATALIFLLFHPLLLAIKYLSFSSQQAALFLLPGFGDLAKSLGIFALLLMIFLLFLTLYIKLRYQVWKFSHKFLSLVLLLAGLHLLLIPSDVSIDLTLRIYMIILFSLSLGTALYRVIFKLVVVKFFDYQIELIRVLNGNIFEITMTPIKEKINFLPGQFAFFSFIQKGFSREWHPFSLASDPAEEKLKIVVKNSGDYTAKMTDLKPGAKVKIEGSFGRFSHLLTDNKKQIWIAGGIGITPFLSMVKSLISNSYQADLYWCVHQPQEAIYLEDLLVLAGQNNNLKIIPFFTAVSGRLTAAIINRQSNGLDNKEIFLCGPLGMMQSLKKQLKFLNKRIIIHSEEFSL